jgi:hypothetical protein
VRAGVHAVRPYDPLIEAQRLTVWGCVVAAVLFLVLVAFVIGYRMGDDAIDCGKITPPTWIERHLIWPTIH